MHRHVDVLFEDTWNDATLNKTNSFLLTRCGFDYRPQRSWGKVMFLQACVILFTGGCLPQCMLGYHPPEQTPPWEQTPPEQTPHGSRHPPRADTPTSRPPGADTPGSRHTPPWEQTPHLEQTTPPPGRRHPLEQTPPEQTHPPGRHTPPRADTSPRQNMLGDTVNARAGLILLECILVLKSNYP